MTPSKVQTSPLPPAAPPPNTLFHAVPVSSPSPIPLSHKYRMGFRVYAVALAHHIIHTSTASASRGMRYLVCRKAAFRSLQRARRAARKREARAERGFMRMTALSGTFFF